VLIKKLFFKNAEHHIVADVKSNTTRIMQKIKN